MDFQSEIKKRGLKQQFVADLVEISPQELSMYLKNTRTMPERVKIALTNTVNQIPIPSKVS